MIALSLFWERSAERYVFFLLKLFALLAMCLDHIGVVFGIGGWNLIDYDLYRVLRGIGRLAFPIFAYLLINGKMKSKNLNMYLSRLLLFATISQIPFTLAFYPVNLMHMSSKETLTWFSYNGSLIIDLILLIAYWAFICKKHFDKSLLLLATVLVLSGISLKVNGIWILSAGNLNVFYTLSLGLIVVIALDNMHSMKKEKWYQFLFIAFVMILSIIYIASRSDYGVAGLLLISGIYLFKHKKLWQVIFICFWGFAFYGIINENMYNAVFCCISIIFILLYNEKKGLSIKYIFYIFYPLHLFILGLFNIIFRLR